MRALKRQLKANGNTGVVVEAFFCPDSGSLQRREVLQIASDYGFRVRFIWCFAPRDDCRQRVMQDYDGYGAAWYPERSRARIGFINRVQAKHFEPRSGEAMPCLENKHCSSCYSWPLERPERIWCSWCGGVVDTSECCHCAGQQGAVRTCSQACENAKSGGRRRSRSRSRRVRRSRSRMGRRPDATVDSAALEAPNSFTSACSLKC
ncbi:hypothetical protein HYH03_003425 [Edaphochlamys debaryana]|uniref:Uncharacterized protein n=1 Tax=Edaphochlamys debaryana TaxID=47281 RepID=A0A835YD66_9CHLO|nr:hypothetical protein HYH03_003425 [Edaphochlamys debaryana]|eukprot:KAG2498681.1 hypothetical protein HYH03_003425 [Edaphochlamys debaryana]